MRMLSQFSYVSKEDQHDLIQKYPNIVPISIDPIQNEVLLIRDILEDEEANIAKVKLFKGDLVIIELTKLNQNDKDLLHKVLKKLYRLKKVFVLKMNQINNATLIELKETFKLKFKIVFDPANLLKQQHSPLAFYRMFKDHIHILVAHDMKTSHRPQLIGYGDTEIINIIKRMKRDHFKGEIWLDPDFNRVIQTPKISLVEKLLPVLFKEKAHLKEKLSMDIKKDITSRDVYDNQIQVLNVIFKLW